MSGLLGLAYGQIMRLRNWCYDHQVFRVHRVNVPVISVGNIVLGGSGKTPVVIALAETMDSVAIVTRGYKSRAEHGPPQIASDDWRKFGDEAALMVRRLPHAMVIVGKDRVAGARLAVEQGAKAIIMDDGMQHRGLHRDVEIVVVNDDLASQKVFPSGILREPLSGMDRADYVVQPEYRTTADYCGMRVGIFCGIAKPHRFLKTVEDLGGEVVHHRFLRDHAPLKDVDSFIAECKRKGAEKVLCTEKDWVKLPPDTEVEAVRIDCILPKSIADISFGSNGRERCVDRKV